MTRKLLTILVTALLVLSAIPAPALAFVPGENSKFTGAAAEVGTWFGTEIPDYAVQYGASGNPGWYVYVEDNKTSSLEKWANASDARTIQDIDAENNRILVSAPADDIGVSLVDRVLNRGLAGQSYVTAVDLHIRMQNVESVNSLQSADDYSVPITRRVTGQFLSAGGSFNTDGVAFGDEVNTSTIADVRDAIGADEVTEDGTGIRVAVIDTGCNVANGLVFGNGSAGSAIRIVDAYNAVTDTEADLANDSYAAVRDGNLHGTWVAAAAVGSQGVAPNASLMCYKSLNDEGSGSTQDIIESIERADANGADIIAMSLGSPIANAALADEIREVLAEGNVTAVSIAVGNARQTTRWVASPGDVDEALAVAAATTDTPANASSAYFSNVGPDSGIDNSRFDTRGSMPDLSAPGMKITAQLPDSDGDLTNRTLSGTSMAQPFVAGSVALLLDSNASLINESERVHKIVIKSASPAPNMGVTETGYGFINVSNMVSETYPETTQEEARTDGATGRDIANVALAGYPESEGARTEDN